MMFRIHQLIYLFLHYSNTGEVWAIKKKFSNLSYILLISPSHSKPSFLFHFYLLSKYSYYADLSFCYPLFFFSQILPNYRLSIIFLMLWAFHYNFLLLNCISKAFISLRALHLWPESLLLMYIYYSLNIHNIKINQQFELKVVIIVICMTS